MGDEKRQLGASPHPALRFAGTWNPNDPIYAEWRRIIRRNRRLRDQLGDEGFYDYLLHLGREDGIEVAQLNQSLDEATEE
jgi:hypothetical protein